MSIKPISALQLEILGKLAEPDRFVTVDLNTRKAFIYNEVAHNREPVTLVTINSLLKRGLLVKYRISLVSIWYTISKAGKGAIDAG
jgi:hypothetical protein